MSVETVVCFLNFSEFKKIIFSTESTKRERSEWHNHDIIAAISAVRDDKMSIAQAAREHNVPRKTLDDRIKNKVVHGTRFIR